MKKTSLFLLVFGLVAGTLLLYGGAPQLDDQVPDYTKIGNPAAVYCREMGYTYQTVTDNAGGQTGVCLLPEETECNAWDFLSGQCGADYSYCAQNGFETLTLETGGAYAPQHAVCVDASGTTLGTVEELSSLAENLTSCGEGESSELPARKPPTDFFTTALEPAALPASLDWRNNGGDWLTPVKDQGICGSCWAFSAVGAAEAALEIAANDPNLTPNLSEQYMVSDCVTTIWGYQNCCGGWEDEALKYIRDKGIPDEACMTYVDGSSCGCDGGSCDSNCTYRSLGDCSDRTCTDRCSDWSSRLTKIKSTGAVSADRATIKTALVEKGPLSAALYMGGSFDLNGVYKCAASNTPNHAIVLVGYDEAGQYWLVRNSWGSTWNGNGYFKVGYGQCQIENYVTYAVAEPLPQAPAGFGKTAPGDSAGYLLPQVEVGWTASAGAESYEVCVDSTDNDTCDEEWVSTGAAVSHAFTSLVPGSSYFWQARAVNTIGTTYANAGDWWSFSIATTQPAYDEKLTTSKVALDWEDYPGAVAYKLQLSKSPNFLLNLVNLKVFSSSYSYNAFLSPSTTYYWRIKPVYADSKGPWSKTYRFESMDPLTAPLLTTPAHLADATSPVTLSWESVTNAAKYKVQVASDAYFLIKVGKARTRDLTTIFDLPAGNYYWRVRAIDASGKTGPWSEVRLFKVVIAP